ncbi:hypothetical protein R1flu_000903 [Riccia fluitans]|uniref:Uncharacterized protein n=1 Tax=Riccia fluitans TaxID=41844 RepID=A0ABD1Y1R0_9MARC
MKTYNQFCEVTFLLPEGSLQANSSCQLRDNGGLVGYSAWLLYVHYSANSTERATGHEIALLFEVLVIDCLHEVHEEKNRSKISILSDCVY